MRERLITKYHKTLTADDSLTAEFFAHLKNQMRKRRLFYGDREISAALRPHLLTQTQYNILAASAQILAVAFEKIATALLNEPSRMRWVGLSDREIKLATVEPKHSRATVTSRLDAFVHGREVRFVEYNAENPSSITDQASLNEVLLEVGALQDLAKQRQLRQFSPEKHLLDGLMNTYREWGGTGVPNIAILDWEGLPTADEFVLLRDFFMVSGVRAIICAPEHLEYREGKLRCGAFPIDLIYKRVIISELLDRCDDSHPLIRAYVAGDVCLVNNFRCKLVHKKAAFGLLTDETHANWFTARERQVIHRTVPWTRRIVPGKTNYGGKKVDLVEHIRKHRSQFVLKPNDDYGGRGITFGENSTTSEWESALSEALRGDYVVQEKIKLRKEVFPIFSDSHWALQPMYVDTNPFLFAGRVEGALVRLADVPVVNVTSGGGETGFMVIEGETPANG